MRQSALIEWDRIGVAMSALCMVHCLALPVIFALLPALTVYEHFTDTTHRIFGVALVAISLFAFLPGYRRHRAMIVFVLGACGLGLVVFAAFAGERWLGEYGEIGFTVAGSILLILAHLRNRTLCQRCSCDGPAPVVARN